MAACKFSKYKINDDSQMQRCQSQVLWLKFYECVNFFSLDVYYGCKGPQMNSGCKLKKVFWHRHKYDHIHRIPLYWSASSFFLFFVGYFLLYMWGFLRSVSALSYFKIQQTEKNCISNVLIKNTLAHQISVKSLTSPRKINTRLTSFVGLKHLHFVSTIYSHWPEMFLNFH